MGNSNRALRRHHVARIKAKTKEFGRGILFRSAGQSEAEYEEQLRDWTNRTHQHPQSCSCEMCCNPRRKSSSKNDRLSLQERRMLLTEDDE